MSYACVFSLLEAIDKGDLQEKWAGKLLHTFFTLLLQLILYSFYTMLARSMLGANHARDRPTGGGGGGLNGFAAEWNTTRNPEPAAAGGCAGPAGWRAPAAVALKQEPCQLRPLSSFYIFFTGGFLPKKTLGLESSKRGVPEFMKIAPEPGTGAGTGCGAGTGGTARVFTNPAGRHRAGLQDIQEGAREPGSRGCGAGTGGTGGTGGVALKQDSCQPKHFFDDCSRPTPGFPVCGRSKSLRRHGLTPKMAGELFPRLHPRPQYFCVRGQNILHTIDLREILRIL